MGHQIIGVMVQAYSERYIGGLGIGWQGVIAKRVRTFLGFV